MAPSSNPRPRQSAADGVDGRVRGWRTSTASGGQYRRATWFRLPCPPARFGLLREAPHTTRGVASRTMQDVLRTARRDGRSNPGAQQIGDLRQQNPQVCVQPHERLDYPGVERRTLPAPMRREACNASPSSTRRRPATRVLPRLSKPRTSGRTDERYSAGGGFLGSNGRSRPASSSRRRCQPRRYNHQN